MSRLICFTCFFTILMSSLSAQESLKSQLEGKKNLQEIMKIVDQYYDDHDDNWRGVDNNDQKLKHWKRWHWYMSGRVGTQGELVNFQDSLLRARHKIEKQVAPDNQGTQRIINKSWKSIGPDTTTLGVGRADRIAFHPTDPNTFYVGTPAGGLWRTTSGGASWTPLTDHMASIGISGVVVDWDNPSTIYILSGDGDSQGNLSHHISAMGYAQPSYGVYKSTDSGNTWKKTGSMGSGGFLPFRLRQSPVSPNTLLVATSDGVYRTINGGASWTKTLTEYVCDIEFKPGSSVVFAASQDSIYYSSFSGSSWQGSQFNIPLMSPSRIELAVTPAQPNYVYAFTGDLISSGVYSGTYLSVDNGLTFVQRHNSPNLLGSASDGLDTKSKSWFHHAFAVSSANPNKVVSGGVKIWTSSDAASNFTFGDHVYHGDVHELAYNPIDHKLYACDDGGVFVSDDDGVTWTSLMNGFRTSQIYHMTGTPLDANYFLAGLQDNGLKYRNSSSPKWDSVFHSDGFDVAFNSIDKTQFYSTINSGAVRFSNNGASSTSIKPPRSGGSVSSWFGTIATHVSDPNTIYIGYDSLQISTDNGNTWTQSPASGFWSLATCPDNSNRLYAAGASSYANSSNGSISRTDDGGMTWDTLQDNTGFPASNQFNKITDIAVHPGNSDFVYITFGSFFTGIKVFRSTNGGATWQNYSGSLPNIPIFSVAVGGDGSQVFIGTDVGVFYRGSGMSDWMPIINKLPNSPITDLYIDDANDDLYASTFGRGVWRIAIDTNCPNSLALGGSLKGDFLYQVNSQITSTTNVIGGIGTHVHFQSGGRVILTPGFIAQRHTKFSAYIQGCGTGGIPGFQSEEGSTSSTDRSSETSIKQTKSKQSEFQ